LHDVVATKYIFCITKSVIVYIDESKHMQVS